MPQLLEFCPFSLCCRRTPSFAPSHALCLEDLLHARSFPVSSEFEVIPCCGLARGRRSKANIMDVHVAACRCCHTLGALKLTNVMLHTLGPVTRLSLRCFLPGDCDDRNREFAWVKRRRKSEASFSRTVHVRTVLQYSEVCLIELCVSLPPCTPSRYEKHVKEWIGAE